MYAQAYKGTIVNSDIMNKRIFHLSRSIESFS